MRAFIVLCLIAATRADVSSLTGYNYQQGGSVGVSGGGGLVGLGGVGGSSVGLGVGYSDGVGVGSVGVGGVGLGGVGVGDGLSGVGVLGGSGVLGGVGGGVGLGGLAGDGGFGGSDADYEKEFYTFSANDADFYQPQANNELAGAVKRNLQVVFIKGPENTGLEDAALSLAQNAGAHKTAVYVLQKQTDFGDLANRLNAANAHQSHKPEVHFVKYRTPEDAALAQQQIQNQYAAQGGLSSAHDGGIAPVLDFASRGHSVGVAGHGGYSVANAGSSYIPPAVSHAPAVAVASPSYVAPVAPSNSYIPASVHRRARH